MTRPEVDSRTPLPTSWRRDDIQGLRAVAVLLVVAFHAGLPVRGGFIGVDVFFVISGFVITELILRNLASPQGFRLRTFYARRFKRLLPALALMVSVVVVLAVLLESPFGAQQTTAATALGAVFFVANFVIYARTGGYFDAPAEVNPLLHTWSLSVEEQFYFIFPALMALSWWIGRKRLRQHGRATAVVLLVILTVVSFALCVLMSYDIWSPPLIGDPVLWAFYSSITRAWEFAVGALLALALTRWPGVLRGAVAQTMTLVGAALILVSAMLLDGSMVFPGAIVAIPVAGSLLVIGGGAGGKGAPTTVVSRLLALPIMVWLGALSYSWYLWHWPSIVYARVLWPLDTRMWAMAGIGSLALAWLAYRFVENPIRENNAIRGPRIFVLVVTAMSIPAVLSLLLIGGARSYWGNQSIADMAQQIDPLPVSYYNGCSSSVPIGERGDMDCTWNEQATGAPVYLVGDSQAGQLAEAAIGAGEQLGRPVTIADMNSCPFIVEGTLQTTTDPACRAFVDSSLAWLDSAPQGTVVLAVSPLYVQKGNEAAWSGALSDTISRLTDAGHSVVLLQAIPQFASWLPATCSLLTAWSNTDGCGQSLARDGLRAYVQPAIDAFADAAASSDATLLDLWDDLCTTDLCATNEASRWIYRDGLHISVGQSGLEAPVLAAAIQRSGAT